MIPQTVPTSQINSWQDELSLIVREPKALFELLELPLALLPDAIAACDQFPLRAPRPYLDRIKKGDINDPLLKQILPLGAELQHIDGYSSDPLQEQANNPELGLIHKYRSRVLLITSPSCAINCRYCFRRHFPYAENNPNRQQWQNTLATIAADTDINEVILSGGDPLVTSDRQLAWLTEQIAAIPHITRLRIHTRLPVVIPQRITSDTLNWLVQPRLKTIMVLHINHAQEIDAAVNNMMTTLRQAGITLLNQAVLLKGVNDTLAAQVELSERLFECGALPYYLHLLDKVSGAAHFGTTRASALELHQQIQASLPGFLVPKLVQELPNKDSKTLVLS